MILKLFFSKNDAFSVTLEIHANANLNSICSNDLVETNTIPSSNVGLGKKYDSSNGKIAVALLLEEKEKKSHTDKMFLFITCNKIRCKT